MHAGVFQHVGPFAAGTMMAVLEMLSEVVCSEELLGMVTLSEFVHMVEMVCSNFPLRRVRKFFAAVSASVRV